MLQLFSIVLFTFGGLLIGSAIGRNGGLLKNLDISSSTRNKITYWINKIDDFFLDSEQKK